MGKMCFYNDYAFNRLYKEFGPAAYSLRKAEIDYGVFFRTSDENGVLLDFTRMNPAAFRSKLSKIVQDLSGMTSNYVANSIKISRKGRIVRAILIKYSPISRESTIQKRNLRYFNGDVALYEQETLYRQSNTDAEFNRANLTPEQNKNINDLKSIEPAYADYSNLQIQSFIESKIPDSKVKDILWHGSRNTERFENFDDSYIGELDSGYFGKGIYLSPDKNYANGYANKAADKIGNLYATIVNLNNPLETDANNANTNISLINNDGAIVRVGEDLSPELNNTIVDANEIGEVVAKTSSQITILNSPETIAEFKEFVNNQPQEESGVDNAQIEAMIQSGEITFTDEDKKPCAKMGMKSDKFTKGGKWEMIKEFKGASHERGGIDIEIGRGGIKMSGKQGKFEAKFGLVIAANGLVASGGGEEDDKDNKGKDLPEVTITKDLPEVTITAKEHPESTRVKKQLQFIKDNKYETSGNNFAIINKKSNRIFYYDKDHNLIQDEPIITGQDNNDKDYSISMRDWFKDSENKGKTHGDYFEYLKKNTNRITPAGHFTIASLKEEVNNNPKGWKGKAMDYAKDIYAGDAIGQRDEDIEESRSKSYGQSGKLLTLKSDEGVYSSKAIHGTNYPNRVKVLDNVQEAKTRDLSNGCINVNGNSICFETLKPGSGIYILPENSEDLVTVKKRSIQNGDIIHRSKSKIYNVLKDSGLPFTDDTVNFISAVHGKESSFGTNKLVPIEDKLPFFNSDGEFQINPVSFNKYLPKDYKNDFENGVKAVYNFYNANKGNEEHLYSLYNTGRNKSSPYIKKFKKIYKHVKENY